MMLRIGIAAVRVTRTFVMTAALAPAYRLEIAGACDEVMMASLTRMGMASAAAQKAVQKHRQRCHKRNQASKHSNKIP